jgi:FAD/FMN-containing dehydrogenase
MKDDCVLQACVPGVPISTDISPMYQCHGYQSFQVDHQQSEDNISQAEQRAQVRRNRRYLRAFKMLIFTFFLIGHFILAVYNPFPNSIDAVAAGAAAADDDDDRRERILVALKNLDEEMEGDVVLVSAKEKFQLAARVWRQGLQPPLAVIEAASQDDVAKAAPILAGLAKEYQMDFRVKSGGHSYAGASTIPDGLVLSISKLDMLTLRLGNSTAGNTSENATVVVEPGVNMEQFMKQVLDQNGYASTVSAAAGVGFGGFVLGGGYGYTSRIYGLAMDNVVRIRAVLVNGTVTDVFPGDDLFWALCGSGGGNFAVAVEYEVKVYPSNDMKLGAKIKLPLSQLVEFLQKLGAKEPELDSKFIASVHEIDNVVSNKNGTHPYMYVLQSSNGTATVSLHWMGDSDDDTSDQQIGMDYIKHHILPLIPRAQRRNVLVTFYYFSWSGVTRQKEQSETWTTVWAAQTWNGFLLPQNNTRQVWESIYKDMTTMFRYCTFLSPNIELWGGAISKVAPNDTAFSHRQAVYNVGVQLLVPNGTANAEHIFQDQAALVSAVWPSIARHLKGVYVNYPMPSLSKEEYPRAYWGDNLERLIELKEQYDPDHVMRYEQSIPGKNESFYFNLDF